MRRAGGRLVRRRGWQHAGERRVALEASADGSAEGTSALRSSPVVHPPPRPPTPPPIRPPRAPCATMQAQKRFINDTIRNDFHRRFLERYIK